MELMLKSACVALIGSLLGLLLKRNTPELGLMLALATSCVLFLCALELFGTVSDFIHSMAELASLPGDILLPLFQTTGIAVVTRLTAEFCRDAGEKAIAATAELTGSLLALIVTIPVFTRLVELMQSLM